MNCYADELQQQLLTCQQLLETANSWNHLFPASPVSCTDFHNSGSSSGPQLFSGCGFPVVRPSFNFGTDFMHRSPCSFPSAPCPPAVHCPPGVKENALFPKLFADSIKELFSEASYVQISQNLYGSIENPCPFLRSSGSKQATHQQIGNKNGSHPHDTSSSSVVFKQLISGHIPVRRNGYNNLQTDFQQQVRQSSRNDRKKSSSPDCLIEFSPSRFSSAPLNDQLSSQIYLHFLFNRQPDQLFRRKILLRDELYSVISRFLYPMCGLYVVGSSMNGLGTNGSDMDLCLMITSQEICQRTDAVDILHRVANVLDGSELSDVVSFGRPPPVRCQQLILAKVPILRIQFGSPFDDIQVDLNANNSVAIKNTHLLFYYTLCDWRVRPLILIVKEWARTNGINDASKSTLSSYSLVLMVIHYLQVSACHQAYAEWRASLFKRTLRIINKLRVTFSQVSGPVRG